ncbi:MAG: DNA polymerase I, partial [Bdellovibrionales bacterium]|nr:DNA polymerase I [Bdellovibrionales bacterium]
LDAFERGVDIHTQTAAQINKISIADVSGQERSMAKAVNFGLIYGQSAFGLSKSLGISRGEAAEYIVQYFEHFSQIKVYLDTLKESCTELGYAETMFGRKRFIPEIYSSNRNVKSMAEREAINSPIQGSAADLIKKAMILVDKKMQQKNLQSKMLLQVHDELIFEVEESELPSMQELVKREMEGVVKLSVPLVVDMGFGVSWYHLK